MAFSCCSMRNFENSGSALVYLTTFFTWLGISMAMKSLASAWAASPATMISSISLE